MRSTPGDVPALQLLLQAIALFVSFAFAVSGSIALSRHGDGIAMLWYANTIAVAFLIANHRRHWPLLLLATALSNIATNALLYESRVQFMIFVAGNLLEIVLAASLIRVHGLSAATLAHPLRLLKLLLLACAAPPLLGASLVASLLHISGLAPFGRAWFSWYEGSVIGSASLMPLALHVIVNGWSGLRQQLRNLRLWAIALLSCLVTLLALTTLPFPFVFINLPLMLAAVLLRPGAVAGLVLLTSLISGFCMAMGWLVAPLPRLPVFAWQEWGHLFLYAPLMVSLVSPLLLSAAMEQMRLRERELADTNERTRVTLDSIGDAVITTDNASRVQYMNPAAERMTGWTQKDAQGKPLAQVFRVVDAVTREPLSTDRAGNTAPAAMSDLAPLLHADAKIETPHAVLISRSGDELAIEDSTAPLTAGDGAPQGTVIVFHDVTAARASAARMSYIAQHDALTGLPNRLLLQDRLLQAIERGQREGLCFALAFLDLDHFKHVNDSLGHAIGDQLLQTIAQRLCAELRGVDTLSRLGGDEFVLLLPNVQTPEQASAVAGKLMARIQEPAVVGAHRLSITASMGISLFPSDARDADELMRLADTAMYRAKRDGRNTVNFFSLPIDSPALGRYTLESELRAAIADQRFLVYYQPKLHTPRADTTQIVGCEALVRWQRKDGRIALPAEFIDVAEESGLIVAIGRSVLRQACAQTAAWNAQRQSLGLPPLRVSVNVSAAQFRQKDLVEMVAAVLRETGLPACELELELTESTLMPDMDAALQMLEQLHGLGVCIGIDDFGTGYSSLAYLKRFPIDTLKIDRSFVGDIANGKDDKIIATIVALARELGLSVIAEGVETVAQAERLRTLGCYWMQGYLFGGPQPADVLAQQLDKRSDDD